MRKFAPGQPDVYPASGRGASRGANPAARFGFNNSHIAGIMQTMKQRIHLRITGRVQGVSYRAYALRKATELGLGGWVRNVTDGTVELVAEGNPEPLGALLDWCWQGSPWAQVQAIDARWSDATGEHTTFSVDATR